MAPLKKTCTKEIIFHNNNLSDLKKKKPKKKKKTKDSIKDLTHIERYVWV